VSEELVIYETAPSSPESFIYQVEAVEGQGDEEKAETFLRRRNDLLDRINEQDKMHIAMNAYNQECSEKTRDLVRQRRRVRESEERRRAGFEKSLEGRRKAVEVLTAEQQHQKTLEETYDQPKSKLRQRKAKAPQFPQGFIPVIPDGPTETQNDGPTEA
jgi:hypothetical protein